MISFLTAKKKKNIETPGCKRRFTSPKSAQFPSGAKAENRKIYITAYLEEEEEEKEEGRRSADQLLHRRRGDRPEKKKKKRLRNASSRRLICPPHLQRQPFQPLASIPNLDLLQVFFFFSPSTIKPNIDFDMIFLSPLHNACESVIVIFFPEGDCELNLNM